MHPGRSSRIVDPCRLACRHDGVIEKHDGFPGRPRSDVGFHVEPHGVDIAGRLRRRRVGIDGRPRLRDGSTAMSEERLTEIPTSWTTIRSAHTPGPESQAAMDELVGRYHDAVDALHPPEAPRQAPRRRGLPGVLDQAADRQARRRRQEQGAVPRLPADGPPPADHRPLPGPQAPAAAPGRPARPVRPRRGFRPRLARGRHQPGLVAARDLPGHHPQEPLRHASSSSASIIPRPRSRTSPSSSASRPARRSPPRRSARTSSEPAPSSRAADPGAARDHPPRRTTRTSRPRSSTSAWATSTAATPPRREH